MIVHYIFICLCICVIFLNLLKLKCQSRFLFKYVYLFKHTVYHIKREIHILQLKKLYKNFITRLYAR